MVATRSSSIDRGTLSSAQTTGGTLVTEARTRTTPTPHMQGGSPRTRSTTLPLRSPNDLGTGTGEPHMELEDPKEANLRCE
uniref:Uncharacterized protein n=1 Tax=Cannabis sativa TaxID=3483 RepID=A0A803NL05_CANSA